MQQLEHYRDQVKNHFQGNKLNLGIYSKIMSL